jgi:GT2 family glycosyltransferase
MTPPVTKPEISIVLGAYNRRRFLMATLESIRNNGITVPYEIIVIDGGSTDGSLRWLAQQKDVITIIQHNRGTFRGQPIPRRSWGYFMNLGFKAAQGKYILMLSDDCLLVPGTVMNGYRHFEDLQAQGQPIAALAFYWRNWPDRREYWVGLTFKDKMYVNHGMYLREALMKIGWIDEEAYRFYYADADLSLRLWTAGFTIHDCPQSFVEHFSHANSAVRSSNNAVEIGDRQTYIERWSPVFGMQYDEHSESLRFLAHDDRHQTAKGFVRIADLHWHLANIRRAVGRFLRKHGLR